MKATYTAIILGGIWWPYGATCSTERTFTADSDEDAIERAETTEAGDFSSVQDTCITKREHCGQRNHSCLQCRHDSPFCPYLLPAMLVKDWANEDNEFAYFDTVREDME